MPLWAMSEPLRQDSVWVRKPAHAYGWDIMPRALSAGLWRPVELVTHASVEVARLYPATVAVHDDVAEVNFCSRAARRGGCRGRSPSGGERPMW